MLSFIRFFKDSWQELKQANWLTRPQMIASTWLVILLVIVFSIYVGTIDFIISFLFKRLMSL